jgi:hypothetical protein
MDTLAEMRQTIRALIQDFVKKDTEVFEYETGDYVFTLQESNISEIVSVSINNVALESGQWSYSDGEITIADESGILSSGDIVSVKYTYTKYSDTELDEYIRASLSYINVIDNVNYKVDSDDIYPTPDSKMEHLICLIVAIMIKPNYTTYRLPNLTVSYPTKLDKDEKIQKLVDRFKYSLGVIDESIEIE